jgi:hypothetical protein
MSNSSSSDNPKKLMNELDELMDVLSDGPEFQGELKLPEGIEVPVLTVKVGEDTEDEADADLDGLVDELVNMVLPRLETELRRRLKKKLSDLPD